MSASEVPAPGNLAGDILEWKEEISKFIKIN